MKLYKSDRFKTTYLVKGGAIYFYSVVREKYMPTTRRFENLVNIATLIGNNFKPDLSHKAFKHVK